MLKKGTVFITQHSSSKMRFEKQNTQTKTKPNTKILDLHVFCLFLFLMLLFFLGGGLLRFCFFFDNLSHFEKSLSIIFTRTVRSILNIGTER